MSCEVCSLNSSADPILWTCVGCPRMFHAACVGVPVQRNSLRKKDSKRVIDVSSYVLPCCGSCQNLITANFEFNVLVEQQAKLADQINKNTEVTHRSTAHQNNVSVVHEGIDRLETLLVDIKKQLTAIGSSGFSGNVSAIKNHITSLCDIAMQSSKENVSTSIQSMTSGISNDLKCLNDDIKHIKSLTSELAANASVQNNPMLGLDLMDQLKTLSADINTIETKIRTVYPDSVISLEDELNAPLTPSPDPFSSLNSKLHNIKESDYSGWRLLGNRKVWKPDWSDYDARELHRLNQQKLAAKARKRRKLSKRHNIFGNNTQSHDHHRNNSNNNRIDNNRNSYNNSNNINRNTIFGNRLATQNNNHSSNNCNSNNHNFNGSHGSNFLPPDRELLAAAKVQFSRPPVSFQPVQFEKRETLNPYPPSDSANSHLMALGNSSTPCETCTCRHSCFRRN